jgi:MFS family permease
MKDVTNRGKQSLEKIEEESELDDPSINWGQRRRIFVLFILGNLFLNYDNGVIPACLLQIEKDLKLGQSEMALMGSIVYFGLSVSSLLVSIIFQKFSASWILGLNMIANAVACFLFSISTNHAILYVMRFMLGFTQAFCVIYGPVWVNEFSPRESNTKWMAILHSFVVIGIMIGYIMGAITVTLFEKYLSWRFAFMLQGWFMILIGIGFIMTDNKNLDIFGLMKGGGPSTNSRPKSFSDPNGMVANISAPNSLVVINNVVNTPIDAGAAVDNVSSNGGVRGIAERSNPDVRSS